MLTPRLGYVTRENMTELYAASMENILAWLAGTPIRVVNPDVRPKA
jgi:D-3-phosphoglycerate dehydrogenase